MRCHPSLVRFETHVPLSGAGHWVRWKYRALGGKKREGVGLAAMGLASTTRMQLWLLLVARGPRPQQRHVAGPCLPRLTAAGVAQGSETCWEAPGRPGQGRKLSAAGETREDMPLRTRGHIYVAVRLRTRVNVASNPWVVKAHLKGQEQHGLSTLLRSVNSLFMPRFS